MDVKETIAVLREMLIDAKAAETAAIEARRAIEARILDLPEVACVLKREGTTTIEGISVQTGYTREWDDLAVADFMHEVDSKWFPFRISFKEDRKKSKAIEEMAPDLWEKLSTALTLKPKKPAVVVK